jgi:hypothetical protein
MFRKAHNEGKIGVISKQTIEILHGTPNTFVATRTINALWATRPISQFTASRQRCYGVPVREETDWVH